MMNCSNRGGLGECCLIATNLVDENEVLSADFWMIFFDDGGHVMLQWPFKVQMPARERLRTERLGRVGKVTKMEIKFAGSDSLYLLFAEARIGDRLEGDVCSAE